MKLATELTENTEGKKLYLSVTPVSSVAIIQLFCYLIAGHRSNSYKEKDGEVYTLLPALLLCTYSK